MPNECNGFSSQEKKAHEIEVTPEIRKQLDDLHASQRGHPFWSNKFFKACTDGRLNKQDFCYIFSQYFLYSKNFTRYLSAVMTNCESDYYRALLSANLWEEGGGLEPEKRHANIFRKFLLDTFALKLDEIQFDDHTKYFYTKYLDSCIRNDAMYGSAFLSLGTEGIVAPMYTILVEGMRKAGISDDNLTFFFIHMECDDEHAETLEQMMTSYSDHPLWYSTCHRAMDEALTLRANFFNQLITHIDNHRALGLKPEVYPASPVIPHVSHASQFHKLKEQTPQFVFRYSSSGGNVNLPTKTIASKILTLPLGQTSSLLKQPFESLIHVLEGSGHCLIDGTQYDINTGDTFYVPPWNSYQIFSSTLSPMRYLITTNQPLLEALGQGIASK